MVKFYAGMIKRDKLTIEDVPTRWRDAVAAELTPETVTEETTTETTEAAEETTE